MLNPFDTIDERLANIEALLLNLSTRNVKPEISKDKVELLTVQDAAKFLSLSVPTIYGLISKGDLPVMKRSKRCYFLQTDLIAYLKAGRKRTNAEIALTASAYVAKGPKV